MECDVIPDCSQEVDPLGDLENCDSLSDDSPEFSLDAQIVSSTDNTYHVHAPPASTSLAQQQPPSSQPPHVRPSASNQSSSYKSTPADASKAHRSNATTTSVDPHAARRKTQKSNPNPTAKKKLPRTQKSLDTPDTSIAPLPAATSVATSSPAAQASTMREVLASIPGFSMKPRRRTAKKMSTAAQIAQTREGCIDLETPDSILVGANLRSLLNKHTFLMLPPLFQYKLVQLLPGVDRPPLDPEPNAAIRLNASSLNNEFFARACLEWRERLSEGEFTPENQSKLKSDAEKEKNRLDPWKLKHFEPIWGRDKNALSNISNTPDDHDNCLSGSSSASNPVTSQISTSSTTTQGYTTTSGRAVRNPHTFTNAAPTAPKRSPRTVGAMTRASAAAVVYQSPDASTSSSEPSLQPLRIKIPRNVNMNVPEDSALISDTEPFMPELVVPVASIDEIDSIIIPDEIDRPITTTSAITVTITNATQPLAPNPKSLLSSAYTIPPGIEVIPLDNNQSPSTIKRAPKRSLSPDRNQIKISKFNEDIRNPNANHHRKSIPSSPSPSNLHNGTCAVSDVIQIIKLPDVSAKKTNAQSNDKPSRDKTSSPLQNPVPSMSVAVTTIAAPLNLETFTSSPTTTTVSNTTARFEISNQQESSIEIIKRPSLNPSQPPLSSSIFVANVAAPSSNEPPTPSSNESRSDNMLLDMVIDLPSITVDPIDNDLDVDETLFAESPADHVFRAMVCHGDDVLCGDVIGHPDDSSTRHSDVLYHHRGYEDSSRMVTIEESVDLTESTSTNDEEHTNGDDSDDTLDRVQFSNTEKQTSEGTTAVEAAVEELEPSIQVLDPLVELDPIEQEFTDAENYVLESGEISADSVDTGSLPVSSKRCANNDETIQASLFAVALARTHDRGNGNKIQSSARINSEIPIIAHSSKDVRDTHTEVIPMQETLEVRLKESTYPIVSADWPYKMDRMRSIRQGDEAENSLEIISEDDTSQQRPFSNSASSMVILSQQANQYATTSQVKLELEVTLTPEAEVSSSTVASHSSNSGGAFCDSDQSNEEHRSFCSGVSTIPTVIPPTTIVCLPSLMSSAGETQPTNVHSTYITSSHFADISKGHNSGQSNVVFTNNNVQRPPVSLSLPPVSSQPNLRQPLVVASSSSLPYLSLASTQPLRAVPQHPVNINRPKAPQLTKNGRGNRGNSNRPPPGAVNLERSYQICQAVIQSSPNRHQLKAQLRPPPSMLGSGPTPSASSSSSSGMTLPSISAPMLNAATCKKDDSVPTKTANHIQQLQPRVAFAKKPGFIQRQPSPVLVRHVFTTNQGIPVSMAVLPSGMHQHSNHIAHQTQMSQHYQSSAGSNGVHDMSSGGINQSGQYILVQRAPGVVAAESPAPRSSSAPPAQHNPQTINHNATQTVARGRPASVDIDDVVLDVADVDCSSGGEGSPQYGEVIDQTSSLIQPQHQNMVPNRKTVSHSTSGYAYVPEIIASHPEAASYRQQPHQFAASGENTPPNCSCSMNAMVICQQCGIFCHDQCMGSAKLCLSCVIR